jgi:hypothetical protein
MLREDSFGKAHQIWKSLCDESPQEKTHQVRKNIEQRLHRKKPSGRGISFYIVSLTTRSSST